MITSLTNKKIKELVKLHQKKYRKDFYLLTDGDMIVKASKCGLLKQLIVVGDGDDENLYVSQEVMDKITKRTGINKAAVVYRKTDSDMPKRCVLLDSLADPQNIGMIIKAAAAFGFDTVYLSEDCADIYHEKCLLTAGESFFDVKLESVDLDQKIDELKKAGFRIYATGLRRNTKELYQTHSFAKMAIIMGNEGHGIKERYYDLADEVVKIPMENIDSLNVAVACGIVMEYYANRGRENPSHL